MNGYKIVKDMLEPAYIVTTTTHHNSGDKSVATSLVYSCIKEANDRFRVESNNRSFDQVVKLFELKELDSAA